jgi:hypothetical protein
MWTPLLHKEIHAVAVQSVIFVDDPSKPYGSETDQGLREHKWHTECADVSRMTKNVRVRAAVEAALATGSAAGLRRWEQATARMPNMDQEAGTQDRPRRCGGLSVANLATNWQQHWQCHRMATTM